MIIKCFRCSKEIDTPNAHNADYIMAEDTKVMEIGEDGTPIEIQKAAIICPDCYKPTDTIIWGVHKK
jgi:DNA-directed RNA polymerase subunit RPC12/RpoP